MNVGILYVLKWERELERDRGASVRSAKVERDDDCDWRTRRARASTSGSEPLRSRACICP